MRIDTLSHHVPASQPRSDDYPCVLLTATVSVRSDMCLTVRTDTGTRLNDYRQAFHKWLAAPSVRKIVLVENSGFELSEFAAMSSKYHAKAVELLTFQSPPFQGSRGKGYGEMLCLQHALRESALLRSSGHVVKASGRYFLRNVDRLLDYLCRHPDLSAVCNLKRNLTWADSRAFAASVSFLEQYFVPRHELIDDSLGVCFENVLACAVHQLLADGGHWSMMPWLPEIEGIHATDNKRYRLGYLEIRARRLLHYLRLRLMGNERSV